jgi:alpha-L-rhamnosidase
LVNTIHSMTRRTIANNLTGVPTDTPMYEKRGWLGDAQLYTAPGVDNFDMQSFLESFLQVMHDDQGRRGNFGDLAPANGPGKGADPTWSSAGLVIPWRLYQEYGDVAVLGAHYGGMCAFVDYLTSVARGGIVTGTYGDWSPPDSMNPFPPEGTDLVSTASYYRSAHILSGVAGVLGRAADAAGYAALASTVLAAFNAAFLDTSTSTYHGNIPTAYRQTSNALPLYLDMVPAAQVDAVVANLVTDIVSKGNHLDTGIIGTMALFPALTQYGHVDTAYAVATQTTFPSYGYCISLGATTLWEQWQKDPRSHDHSMFGTVDDWFFKYLLGIKPAAAGYKRIAVRPYVPSNLRSADGYRLTPYGRVSVGWAASATSFDIDVGIPSNTTALVSVPAPPGAGIEAHGPTVRRGQSGAVAHYEVGAGTSTIRVRR